MARGLLSGGVKTEVYEDSSRYTCVSYRNTVVAKWNPFEIILDTGGWYTVTTKRRMNQASNEFNLGFSVSQVKGDWIVSFKGKDTLFYDGMTLQRKEQHVP